MHVVVKINEEEELQGLVLIRINRGDDLDKSKDGKVSYEELLGTLMRKTFITSP